MNDRLRTISLVLIIAVGIIPLVALARLLDAQRSGMFAETADESLYLNAKTARRLSLGFNGLVADWYWMRSLQYVGRKILGQHGNIALDDLGQLDLKLLAPLLDNATTLDPQFLDPYEYAAVVLPAIDVEEAIRITRKGIDANPNAWRLYQQLGYIYWQQGNYAMAADVYGRGAQLPGAPAWMEAMRARMAAEGGSRATAREIYTRMFEQSGDENVKEMAHRRLLQLDSLDQRDGLRKLLVAYQTRAGRCPTNWRELNLAGVPLDPSGAPYVLNSGKCDVELDSRSEIIVK